MRPLSKALLVTGGYVAAVVVAVAAVDVNAAAGGAEREASSGMAAFGDAVLFLGVFGLASIPATGAALFFLRDAVRFWRIAVAISLAIAATGIAAVVGYLAGRTAEPGSALAAWAMLAPLRILLAPLLAPVFLLSAAFAPARATRGALFGAAAAEAGAFGVAVLVWLSV